MGKRGRPANSAIRRNIIEILYFLGTGYGYEVYKCYVKAYPKVTMRSVYYHLNKGVELGEIEIAKIQKEEGDYSWGRSAEKIYYKLGKNANPRMDKKALEAVNEKNGK